MDMVHTVPMTPTRTLGYIAGLTLAAVLVTGHALTTEAPATAYSKPAAVPAAVLTVPAGIDPAADPEHAAPVVVDCTPLTLTDFEARVAAGVTNPAIWDELVTLGWHGSASDHREALYHPDCFVTAEDGTEVLRSFYTD